MEKTIQVTMTRRITEAAQEAARVNGAKAKSVVTSEEHKAKLREAQRLRREREQAAREASGVAVQTIEKKAVGRPRKAQPEQTTETAPKRGRGRPKTKTEQNTPLPLGEAETGA